MPDLITSVSFFALGVIGWAIYKIYIWPIYLTPLRNIPGPPSEDLFYGNVKTLRTEEEPQLEWIKRYGKIVKFHSMFNEPIILVADLKMVQEILLGNNYDYVKSNMMKDEAIAFTGTGLVFVEGETHKKQRRMMNPSFTYNNIKEMVPTFNQVAANLKNVIEDKVNLRESNINLSTYISHATLDVIGLVGFNYEFNSLNSSTELGQAYAALTSPLTDFEFTFKKLASYVPFLREMPIDINKKFKNACTAVERISERLIEEKYKEAKNGKLKGKDLLSLLININNALPIEEKLTDDELKYQIMTFLLAGHETTSTAISWALLLLAQRPHEQDKLREELVKTFPDKSNFNPTFDEINSLEYLNYVVKEAIRLYPPVTTLNRTNLKDKVFGKYLIPKNTTLAIPISVIQKSPEIWGRTAEEFDPKRWLDPSLTKNISNLNYLPFGAGPRSCIGNKLALIEFKVLLGILIRNFVFQSIEGFNIERRAFSFFPKPNPYLKLTVSRVES